MCEDQLIIELLAFFFISLLASENRREQWKHDASNRCQSVSQPVLPAAPPTLAKVKPTTASQKSAQLFPLSDMRDWRVQSQLPSLHISSRASQFAEHHRLLISSGGREADVAAGDS